MRRGLVLETALCLGVGPSAMGWKRGFVLGFFRSADSCLEPVCAPPAQAVIVPPKPLFLAQLQRGRSSRDTCAKDSRHHMCFGLRRVHIGMGPRWQAMSAGGSGEPCAHRRWTARLPELAPADGRMLVGFDPGSRGYLTRIPVMGCGAWALKAVECPRALRQQPANTRKLGDCSVNFASGSARIPVDSRHVWLGPKRGGCTTCGVCPTNSRLTLLVGSQLRANCVGANSGQSWVGARCDQHLVRSNFGTIRRKFGRIQPRTGRARPKFGRHRRKDNIAPTVAEHGMHLVLEIGPNLAECGRT